MTPTAATTFSTRTATSRTPAGPTTVRRGSALCSVLRDSSYSRHDDLLHRRRSWHLGGDSRIPVAGDPCPGIWDVPPGGRGPGGWYAPLPPPGVLAGAGLPAGGFIPRPGAATPDTAAYIGPAPQGCRRPRPCLPTPRRSRRGAGLDSRRDRRHKRVPGLAASIPCCSQAPDRLLRTPAGRQGG